ncbi:MAG: AAA family ATPase [Kofleriaceae bacterium]|nr:AAA family ATPase [Kofleriaceae bacterium]
MSLFFGDPGTGRTAAASAICGELDVSLVRGNVAGSFQAAIGA